MKILICILLCLMVQAGCGSRSKDGPGDYDEKIKKAQRALEKDYQNSKTHTYLGVLYEKKGLSTQAEKHYRIALDIDDQYLEAYVNLGNLYFSQKDYPGAIQVFQKALRLHPKDDVLIELLANVYKESGQFNEALVHYQSASTLNPRNVKALNSMGMIYYEIKDFDKALATFNSVIDKDPNYGDAYGNLGILYDFNLHQKELAIQSYQKYLELNKEGVNVSLIQDLLQKAQAAVQKKIDPIPTEIDPVASSENSIRIEAKVDYLGQSRSMMRQGRFEEARTDAQHALMAQPQNEDAKILLAIIDAKIAEPRRSREILEKAVQDHKQSAELLFLLAQSYDPGDPVQAMRLYEKVLTLDTDQQFSKTARERIEQLKPSKTQLAPDKIIILNTTKSNDASSTTVSSPSQSQSGSYFTLGAQYQARGQNALAIVQYEKALKLNPGHVKAHYNLGILYKWRGDYTKAIQEYQQTIQLDPVFSKAYYNLGIIFKSQGRYEEAISQFKKAVQIDTRYADAYLGLGLVYSDVKKDKKMAAIYYKRYLMLNPSGPTAAKIRAWLEAVGEQT